VFHVFPIRIIKLKCLQCTGKIPIMVEGAWGRFQRPFASCQQVGISGEVVKSAINGPTKHLSYYIRGSFITINKWIHAPTIHSILVEGFSS